MRIISFLLCIQYFTVSFSQSSVVDKGQVFKDDVVPKIHISLPADSLNAILDPVNRDSDYHYKASFVFDNGNIKDTLEEVGFRLRGNTSRKAAKKSFKISFNEFDSDQEFYGLEKMNINGEHNDPSLSRAKLSFDFLRKMQVPASRTNHVELYINNTYFGLYLNVEHIDEQFTQSRFGSEGPLYKCIYGADLAYRGAAASNYNLSYYELKNPKGSRDYEDLAKFIDVLNNTSDEDFLCAIENVFNVERYLKCLVMDVLTGNWDGPNYNKNNFYLYYNESTGLMEYIPYDLDNTLGVDFIGRDWSTRDIYTWSKGSSGRPFYDKILSNSEFRDRYSYWMNEAVQGYFHPDSMSQKAYAIKTIIQNAAERDTIRTLDYGFSISDFNNSFGYFSKDHVKMGIVDYVQRRIKAVKEQLVAVAPQAKIPTFYDVILDHKNDSVTFILEVSSKEQLSQIELVYNWDFQSAVWRTPLVNESKTNRYKATIEWRAGMERIGYLFEIKDSLDQTIRYPRCDMFSIEKSSTTVHLFINELMAINSNGVVDEEGKTEDWFELYYGGESFINLSDYYITDDITEPFKYALPSKTVGPNSFHLFWADSDESDSANHVNFKLSGAGEELALFNADGALVDWIEFGAQISDISYGRKLDGLDEWVQFNSPTPGASNSRTGNAGFNELRQVRLYPNPSSTELNISTEGECSLQVLDVHGKSIYKEEFLNSIKINVSDWKSGFYIITLLSDNKELYSSKFVKI